MKSGRPVGAASLMEVPLSLDMLTTVSTLTFNCTAFIPRHFDIVFKHALKEEKKKKKEMSNIITFKTLIYFHLPVLTVWWWQTKSLAASRKNTLLKQRYSLKSK